VDEEHAEGEEEVVSSHQDEVLEHVCVCDLQDLGHGLQLLHDPDWAVHLEVVPLQVLYSSPTKQ
jgi:hypothetical protein